jgi:hypothetical protein
MNTPSRSLLSLCVWKFCLRPHVRITMEHLAWMKLQRMTKPDRPGYVSHSNSTPINLVRLQLLQRLMLPTLLLKSWLIRLGALPTMLNGKREPVTLSVVLGICAFVVISGKYFEFSIFLILYLGLITTTAEAIKTKFFLDTVSTTPGCRWYGKLSTFLYTSF